jgi:AcrR family transcriptional regulator
MTKHRNNKETAILEAARKEFLEKGYDGARTTSIAKNAGVTHAMLHYYFKTKEQLFASIFEDFIIQIVSNFKNLFGESDKPFVSRVENAIAEHFNFVAANPRIPLLVIREISSHPERISLLKEIIFENVGGLFQTIQCDIDIEREHGNIGDIDAPTLMVDVLSLNVFPFLVQPIFSEAFAGLMDVSSFFEQRKQENIKLILNRLKPTIK